MKLFRFTIPIMILVGILSMWLLGTKYSEVPYDTRILIAVGGSIVSGIITHFLLRSDTQKIDSKPSDPIKKKR
ncbi:hypothetical protein [Paenisporosarcina sp. TG20]|uniref:hypothetical protein n=1 Tax=Paenisporosarcina sp. TG20 TaxID=1211706 RepID=UPI000370204A|nr:hypothetical protein [Paenisporosarcina sp. TG20]